MSDAPVVDRDLSADVRVHRRRQRPNAGMLVGIALLSAIGVLAVFAPWIAPSDPYSQDLTAILQRPSPEYLLGTDELGRDIFSRVIFGARYELALVLPPVLITLILALPLGMVAGYSGGWVDRVISFFSDSMLTFPSLVAAIILVAILGSGALPLMVTLVITQFPGMVRYIRAFTVQIASSQYILAARASGSSSTAILRGHVLRNILGRVLVILSLFASEAVLVIAALGFLGIGVQPPGAEWGTMLSEGRVNLLSAPHVMLGPGVAIALLILGFNLLGDGLRDAMDNRS